jgi:hypothetical protein
MIIAMMRTPAPIARILKRVLNKKKQIAKIMMKRIKGIIIWSIVVSFIL